MAVTLFGVRLEKNHLGMELSILAQKLTMYNKKNILCAFRLQRASMGIWINGCSEAS